MFVVLIGIIAISLLGFIVILTTTSGAGFDKPFFTQTKSGAVKEINTESSWMETEPDFNGQK